MWQTLKKTVQMHENIEKCFTIKAELGSQNRFDPRGPRKSYSNIIARDPSKGKNIGALLFLCCAICPGHVQESTKESIDVGSL